MIKNILGLLAVFQSFTCNHPVNIVWSRLRSPLRYVITPRLPISDLLSWVILYVFLNTGKNKHFLLDIFL